MLDGDAAVEHALRWRCEGRHQRGLLGEDAEHRLADQLVGQRVVAGVEPAAAHVAVEALELVAGEHAGAAGDVEGDVDDPLGGLHRPPLHRVDLRHPRPRRGRRRPPSRRRSGRGSPTPRRARGTSRRPGAARTGCRRRRRAGWPSTSCAGPRRRPARGRGRRCPRYTAAISDSGHIAMATRNGSLPSPAGTTRPMRSSGTNTPSRMVSWLWVGRMPSVSHVSTTVTPGLVALDEGVDDLRAARCRDVDGVGAEPAPGRPVRAELLAARQAVAALDPLGLAGRQQHGDVVAGLGVAGGEHLAGDGAPRGSSAATCRRPARARWRCRSSRCACVIASAVAGA